jgi:hypothetical protein
MHNPFKAKLHFPDKWGLIIPFLLPCTLTFFHEYTCVHAAVQVFFRTH